ncbi:hypothetical protein [Planktothrix sp. FACHB-1355]|uniref:hypothetical protein n=1 Tax=Planktothrix sp. FACHB-1355 TaxID=2692854 RepID=UPI001682F18E|nr:hypothetical protein [Planktothrix sp. FACHB-1355]
MNSSLGFIDTILKYKQLQVLWIRCQSQISWLIFPDASAMNCNACKALSHTCHPSDFIVSLSTYSPRYQYASNL